MSAVGELRGPTRGRCRKRLGCGRRAGWRAPRLPSLLAAAAAAAASDADPSTPRTHQAWSNNRGLCQLRLYAPPGDPPASSPPSPRRLPIRHPSLPVRHHWSSPLRPPFDLPSRDRPARPSLCQGTPARSGNPPYFSVILDPRVRHPLNGAERGVLAWDGRGRGRFRKAGGAGEGDRSTWKLVAGGRRGRRGRRGAARAGARRVDGPLRAPHRKEGGTLPLASVLSGLSSLPFTS